ncbi:DUF342 domain-containing protein [Kurthia sibirica]|nr:FapA family protein [Kurthia sibirica]GEK33975.1 polymerase [Kurthia sibirica]
MEIFKNEHFELISEDNKIYLKSFTEDNSMKNFEIILKNYPRVRISSFLELKKVFDHPNSDFVEVGILLPEIDIQISKDYMTANVLFNEDPKNIVTSEDELNEKINLVATKMGIKYGLKRILWTELEKQRQIVIAEGLAAEHGRDAEVTYIENQVKKPKIGEDGRADFSDMSFIFEVEKDAWLGERIPATDGKIGKNVLGKEIPAKAGKNLILKYNKESVYENEENGKTIIRAKTSGVLDDQNGMVSILKHLSVTTDIGVETGDLEFDGSITVSGTVLPGYSIKATGDVSIEAKDGVSGAKNIESINGDVFIRGGVFGHAKTTIKAGRNIYLKHANEANLYADEEICIDAYAIGSTMYARKVKLDEHKGKIIGGYVEAKVSIQTGMSGNQHERRTELVIDALDKREKMGEVRHKASKIQEIEVEIKDLTSKIAQLAPIVSKMTPKQYEFFEDTQYQLEVKKSAVIQFNIEIQTMLKQIGEAGNEFINITREAHPGTIIKIGKLSSMIKDKTKGIFKIVGGDLNV